MTIWEYAESLDNHKIVLWVDGGRAGWKADARTGLVGGIGRREEDYGTHSLRRTKAALIYKQTANLRPVQILLGDSKIETTVRYLELEVEDALTLAEATEV